MSGLLKRLLISLFLIFILVSSGLSQNLVEPGKRCRSEFPNLLSDICWRCLFPIRIGGRKILDSGGMPDNLQSITGNTDDFNPSEFVCSCKDNENKNRYGIYISFWEPARVIEVVQRPGCFPFLFGMDLGEGVDIFGAYGTKGRGRENYEEGKAFFNAHYYLFPILWIMDLLVGADFCTDWLSDIDLLYFTEVDPLWNDDELTAYVHPEVMVFGDEIVQALCSTDCIATSSGSP